MNSCATWRLNSMLWERCLAMAFILRKPSYQVNSLGPNCPASGAHSRSVSMVAGIVPPGEVSGIKGCISQIARVAALVAPTDRTLLFCPHRESPHLLQLRQ